MTVTLCIETSGPHCSLALAVNERVHRVDRLLGRRHNEHLLTLLDGLYDSAGVKPVDTGLIGFGCGPGSFTGVRMAASVCQALAMRAKAPVVPLSSSLVLAATALAEHVSVQTVVVSIVSRGEAFYLARYVRDAHGGYLQTQVDELVTDRPAWLDDLGLIAGQIPPWLAVQDAPTAGGLAPSAGQMIPLVSAVHAAGRSVAAEQALPRYFAGDSPWRKHSGA